MTELYGFPSFSSSVVYFWKHELSLVVEHMHIYDPPVWFGKLIMLIIWLRYATTKSLVLLNMMTSSNGNISALLAICAGNSPVPGEIPAQRPVTRSFDVFFDLRLNKPLIKQSWCWWFDTLSRPLWRHCNVNPCIGEAILTIVVEYIIWAHQNGASIHWKDAVLGV